jgi:RNA polymerase sigma-70 factor (ECF subfamily)
MHAAYRRDVRQDSKAAPAPAAADLCERVLRLPLEEREVLMLAAVERLSYDDIAGLLDVSVATVMSTLARAREQLRAG